MCHCTIRWKTIRGCITLRLRRVRSSWSSPAAGCERVPPMRRPPDPALHPTSSMAITGAPVSPGTGALAWDFAALTDPGRVRANNEDTIAFDAALGLVLLADGMGGYNGGEVASGMAI